MAEHRRVESRGIAGTGMTADPDRIRELGDEKERKERAWRNAPEKGFADVLKDAPAHGELADDDGDPRKKKPNEERPEAAPSEAAMASAAIAPVAPAAVALPDTKPLDQKAAKAALPKVPRDPREEMLRRKLAASQASPNAGFQVDTPPTGSRNRKPT